MFSACCRAPSSWSPVWGPFRERRLWCSGVAAWSDLAGRSGVVLNGRADALLRAAVRNAAEALRRRDVDGLAAALPTAEHWRLFGTFGDDAVYLDIETGDDVWGQESISAIGFLDRNGPRLLLAGRESPAVSGAGSQLESPGDVQRSVV